MIKSIEGSVGFPDQLAKDSEKETLEYGLKVGKAIQHEWFNRTQGRGRFYSQWDDFNRLRLYARGEQPVGKYKNELAVDGDLSYLNLDWTPVPIMPKFIDIVVNGMSDRLFKIKAYAQDAMSQSKRSKFQEMIETQMISKDILLDVQDKFGVNPFSMDSDEIPETDDELALYMNMNYKPAIEIAEEEALSTVLEENKYVDTKKKIDYDITTIGIGAVKHEFLEGSGVKVSYVDPAELIYSYTEDPFFKDCFYFGEVKRVPITELYKINPDISDDVVKEIQDASADWHRDNRLATIYGSSFSRDTCSLLYFDYKTTKKFVYKKKKLKNGGFRIKKKSDDFNPPEEMMEEGEFEKVEKVIDVWYEGVMVLGTEIIIDWKLAENMVRPKSTSQNAKSRFVVSAPRMYKGNIESIGRRMLPFVDLIQLTHLKIQQVVAKVVPDGVFIDADGLNEVDLGNGNAYNPSEALRLYFQTGSVVGRSMTQDGELNHARVPIQQLTTSSGTGKLQMLVANYNHYMDMLRTVTGLNEARDGSTPDPKALVGVQKLAALNSNTATRHILDASLYIYRELAEALSCRVSDILEYSSFKDDFINKIGRYNVAILDDIKDLYLHDFGIFIEVSPDEEEKAQLEANIQMALSKGDIGLDDAIDIREIKNIKLANKLLKLKKRKKAEAEEEFQTRMKAMEAEKQFKSQQIAAQVKMQEMDIEARNKMKIKQAEVAFEIEKMQTEANLKRELMREEFMYSMRLQGMTEESASRRESEKEKAKSDRISQQNTQHSQLIDQRKNNLPPKRFESTEDTLDGFGFNQFGPK